MSEAEVASFLTEERTVTCATTGPRGWPHLMPLWYVLRASEPSSQSAAAGPAVENVISRPQIWAWTYAVSQKVRNLERDQRASLQVEAGEQYQE
ncbi:MAG TPA: pyridoxamine 5'-phosphate oxidase family protein, partial [Solirubrobacteraceae bacterium]